ncbi:hypothetical protein SY2F82_32950 [Streptomyces sp. Y2F8-2]|nr:hypothetical protein SY2F82_32950 [Streptomyces sp. Y2F8-2]
MAGLGDAGTIALQGGRDVHILTLWRYPVLPEDIWFHPNHLRYPVHTAAYTHSRAVQTCRTQVAAPREHPP